MNKIKALQGRGLEKLTELLGKIPADPDNQPSLVWVADRSLMMIEPPKEKEFDLLGQYDKYDLFGLYDEDLE